MLTLSLILNSLSEWNDPGLSGGTDRHINVGLEIMCKTYALNSTQTGRYLKIGNTVFFSVTVVGT